MRVSQPGVLTLGLLRSGVWHGLRSVRHADAADWRAPLSALQAQIQLASGFDLSKEPPTVYLVGCGTEAERVRDPRLVFDLRMGRDPGDRVKRRVEHFMNEYRRSVSQ